MQNTHYNLANTTIEIIPKQILRHYLKGGTSFPQIRGSITLALCDVLFSEYELPSIDLFFASTPSEHQLHTIVQSMNVLHEKAGVVIPQDRVASLVFKEWQRSKGSVMLSLRRFFCSELWHCHTGSEIEQLASERVDRVIARIELKRLNTFKYLSSLISQEMFKHQYLSRLYRLTLYSEDARTREYQKNKELYLDILSNYSISGSPINDVSRVRLQCLQVLEIKLRTLSSQYFAKQDYEALIWGIA